MDQEKGETNKYLKCCHELGKDFAPLVDSVDVMVGGDILLVEMKMVLHMVSKGQCPYHH